MVESELSTTGTRWLAETEPSDVLVTLAETWLRLGESVADTLSVADIGGFLRRSSNRTLLGRHRRAP
ncbi:hypothetical protein SAMN05443661_10471 [Natronobacterium gregoryi]|uniref:Uncharacterized protein n=2 Tax=Natronobacterium gregoryi TaxID=44930 RepID=L0AJR7_NATGS|nr:hypothetical protein Natgr_2255 [Natronobacterium gregoryi SP2]ELY68628.1 hypothetical protein C490_09423 [Natronobacterium gregoryi SP2]PLK20459.1 hypothetical protein CYV19_09505 [Natronobacterium gregoryi SP2]SFI72028.1 hypothetical protein SAMN05443661_10471 [Natronobacterium gregoryi]